MWAQTQILGRVGRDPETRFTGGGAQVANFSVATSRKWKDSSGEKKEETTWYPVVAWKKLSEIVQEYVHKGDLILITGTMQMREWTDKGGVKREKWELRAETIKLMGNRKENGNGTHAPAAEESTVSEDEIPF